MEIHVYANVDLIVFECHDSNLSIVRTHSLFLFRVGIDDKTPFVLIYNSRLFMKNIYS